MTLDINSVSLFSLVEPSTEQVQALADILRSALCCHSNETRVPIINPPNSTQLEGTPTISPLTFWSMQ